ncbi:MAG: carbon-nitrogen hydrolase family protein [Bacillota bacterium]|nr:carbon-nitrogen hydrolase family protein [Bacillota bacterium]
MALRVAVGQFRSLPDKEANLERMESFARSAARAGAELLLFPEGAMAPFDDEAAPRLPEWAEELDGPFARRLAEMARRYGLLLVAGLLERPAGAGDAAGGRRVYNTAVAWGPDGRRLAAYRKIHLFDALGSLESDRFLAGEEEPPVFDWSPREGARLRLGLAICYDVRFPEVSRRLAERGAELLLLPSAWVRGLLKEEQWELLVRARALENTCYVLAADQVGGPYCGRSLLADPMGLAAAAAGEEEALLLADVDPGRVRRVREKLPVLRHRRPELYRRWQAGTAEGTEA